MILNARIRSILYSVMHILFMRVLYAWRDVPDHGILDGVLTFLITSVCAQIVSREGIGRRGQTGSIHVGTGCSWVGGGNPVAFNIPCLRIRHELHVKYVVQLLVLLD
jgi:hypothetical protein